MENFGEKRSQKVFIVYLIKINYPKKNKLHLDYIIKEIKKNIREFQIKNNNNLCSNHLDILKLSLFFLPV